MGPVFQFHAAFSHLTLDLLPYYPEVLYDQFFTDMLFIIQLYPQGGELSAI